MTETKIIPLLYRILVKVVEPELPKDLRSKLIEIPLEIRDKCKSLEAAEEGIVISMGKNVFQGYDGTTLNVGDKVAFVRYAGVRKVIDGEECRIINDDEVMAIVINNKEEDKNV